MGKHGDEDRHGVVPNATLVVYLTGSTGGAATAAGQTVFPEAGVAVSPTPGEPCHSHSIAIASPYHSHSIAIP